MEANDSDVGDLHQRTPPLTTPTQRSEAAELAFDYRGDVTVTLEGGAKLVGYVYNRELNPPGGQPYLEMFPSDQELSRKITLDEVAGLHFSGANPAAGRSWEAWQKKLAEAQASGAVAELYPGEV